MLKRDRGFLSPVKDAHDQPGMLGRPPASPQLGFGSSWCLAAGERGCASRNALCDLEDPETLLELSGIPAPVLRYFSFSISPA